MILVYAISSIEKNYIYVGMTADLDERLKRHNAGRERTTRFYAPFRLIYTEECSDRVAARKREKYWKSGVGKEQLRQYRNKNIS
ncbi:GIY-YIG nuclease family protein [Aquimarina intermedia]|uniref:Putative endonuclease n=1 Tax=Aquimarina intermedia TaxID=350814 RepID=A0A5S5CCP8_9FLAO|nr:GIY-YIG nuclease family protein [Aquimarina intermedia]TYP76130.1 putative endonuclease [Aquimarina intermedia]